MVKSPGAEATKLTDWFGDWASKKETWALVEQAFSEGRFVNIRNVLRPDKAEQIYQEMKRSDRWVFREGYEPQYQFRGSSVMENDGLHDHTTGEFNALNEFFAFLEDDAVKSTFSAISIDGLSVSAVVGFLLIMFI